MSTPSPADMPADLGTRAFSRKEERRLRDRTQGRLRSLALKSREWDADLLLALHEHLDNFYAEKNDTTDDQ